MNYEKDRLKRLFLSMIVITIELVTFSFMFESIGIGSYAAPVEETTEVSKEDAMPTETFSTEEVVVEPLISIEPAAKVVELETIATVSIEETVEETTEPTVAETEADTEEQDEEIKYYPEPTDGYCSPDQLEYHGRISWGGYQWTWYSERVLPGGALVIPGRHADENGYICDENDYICIASSTLDKGTVVDTPLGKQGKIYDCGCAQGVMDVYVNW